MKIELDLFENISEFNLDFLLTHFLNKKEEMMKDSQNGFEIKQRFEKIKKELLIYKKGD